MTRSFGIAALEDLGVAAEVARAAEDLGYRSFWTNDTPAADGLAVATAAAAATTSIRIGVGVVACDRRPATQIAAVLEKGDIPLERFVLGIGAGGSPTPVATVAEAAALMRKTFGESLLVGIAAMGPRMCATAGSIADLVLLNWMTPQWILWARRRVAAGERRRELPGRCEVAAYVRVATGSDAAERVAEEAGRYAMLPHYRRHFDRMGADPNRLGVVLPDPGGDQIASFERVLDEAVVRALVPQTGLNPLLDIARAASGSRNRGPL